MNVNKNMIMETNVITKIKPIQLDILNMRTERQRINNILAVESILERKLTENVNQKEYERVLCEIDITESELLDKCANDITMCKILGGRIAINASRQGTKDEELQIETCNITSSKCCITIEQLTTTQFRPTKTGEIITNKQFREKKLTKNDCLKSFDAKISGKKEGWIFAKVVIGDGGHQDNVFEEAYTLCEWIIQFGKKTDIFIILIDTNLMVKFNEFTQKYDNQPNILIGNHITIQQYMIDNYSV